MIAKIHFANDGVAAPTTNRLYKRTEATRDFAALTLRGGNRERSSEYAKGELFYEDGVDASIDEWDCAAAVIAGLHAGDLRAGSGDGMGAGVGSVGS